MQPSLARALGLDLSNQLAASLQQSQWYQFFRTRTSSCSTASSHLAAAIDCDLGLLFQVSSLAVASHTHSFGGCRRRRIVLFKAAIRVLNRIPSRARVLRTFRSGLGSTLRKLSLTTECFIYRLVPPELGSVGFANLLVSLFF